MVNSPATGEDLLGRLLTGIEPPIENYGEFTHASTLRHGFCDDFGKFCAYAPMKASWYVDIDSPQTGGLVGFAGASPHLCDRWREHRLAGFRKFGFPKQRMLRLRRSDALIVFGGARVCPWFVGNLCGLWNVPGLTPSLTLPVMGRGLAGCVFDGCDCQTSMSKKTGRHEASLSLVMLSSPDDYQRLPPPPPP
jgi:hypothetical protein